MNLNISTLFILILAACLISCGGNDADASADGASENDTQETVGKPDHTIKGEIRQEGVEGRWKAEDESTLEIQNDTVKTIAFSGVELRAEPYTLEDTSPCTQETDGPYLVIKGGVTTCYQVMRVDDDSMFLSLSSARPQQRYVRVK